MMHTLNGLERFTDTDTRAVEWRHYGRSKLFADPMLDFDDLRQDAEILQHSPTLEHRVLAASAFNEAAVAFGVVGPESPFYEQQAQWLAAAHTLLNEASFEYQELLVEGKIEQPTHWLRAERDVLIAPLLRAAATNTLDRSVKFQAYNDLCDFILTLEMLSEEVPQYFPTESQRLATVDIRGLCMENIVHLMDWHDDLANQVTIPAPFRGDNGRRNSDYVHDLVRLGFDAQGDLIPLQDYSSTTEVKTRATDEDRARTRRAGIRLVDMSNLTGVRGSAKPMAIGWHNRHLLLEPLTDKQAYSARLDKIYADQS